MSASTLPTTARASIPRLRRWKLTEPLRLFVYGWSLLLLLVAVVAALVSGFWLGPVTVAAVLLLMVPALEAARATCYSEAGMVTALRDALTRR